MAAGEGRRMRPLTLERPKPLVLVAGRPILEHIIDGLPREIDEIILVVGYMADMVKEYFGNAYEGRSIRYVHQWMPAGTAHALSMARPFLTQGRFLLMNADDLHGTRALEEAVAYPLSILVARHEDPSRFGVIDLTSGNTLASIIEKPEHPATNLISTGAMVLDKRIFDFEAVRHESGEYYMTSPLNLFAHEHPITVVEQELWIPVGCPDDIAIAEERLALSPISVLQAA